MAISIASVIIRQVLRDHAKPWANGRGGLTVNEIAKLLSMPPNTILDVVNDMLHAGKLEMYIVDGPPTVMRWLIYLKERKTR
jgi:hypothetical protein